MSARHLRRVPRLEHLERRQVLANWGVSVVEGVLTIEGTNQNDRIVVAVADELGTLSVQFNTQAAQLFNPLDADPTKAFSSIAINGNGGNDRITVGAGVLLDATIDGGSGNDWIWGGGGNDTINAGWGNDHVYGGPGNDVINGEAGNDKLWGGAGDDQMIGENGHDWLHGGAGDDEGTGGNGFDHLHGDDGNDVLHGDAGKDHVHGGLGDDELYGEGDNDLIYGEDGNDWIHGGDNKDKLWGGLGDDMIKGGWGNDHLNGGWGVNLLDGDEGVNKLWNGTETELDDTPPEDPVDPDVPEEPQQDPTYLTTVGSTTLVYQKVGGVDHTLDITGTGFVPGQDVVVLISGTALALLVADPNGAVHIKFSSVLDQPDEQGFDQFNPDTCLFDGTDVFVNDLSGVLNMSQAS
jgi:Ca2+-binding RTX toxin-like protein